MNDDASNLDRLHDLVLPSDVPWWPLAPGWYAVSGIALIAVLVLLQRSWKKWQANAYRRTALRELASAPDAPAIAEILRRTALVAAPRAMVTGKTGESWPEWLALQCSEPLPDKVRWQLTRSIYGRPTADSDDSSALRDYAARWIKHHRTALAAKPSKQC
jgi:hypothetical protein